MLPGMDMLLCNMVILPEPLVPQPFTAATVKDEPDEKLLLKLSWILLVPCPLVIVEPEGAIQLYVTPVTMGVV